MTDRRSATGWGSNRLGADGQYPPRPQRIQRRSGRSGSQEYIQSKSKANAPAAPKEEATELLPRKNSTRNLPMSKRIAVAIAPAKPPRRCKVRCPAALWNIIRYSSAIRPRETTKLTTRIRNCAPGKMPSSQGPIAADKAVLTTSDTSSRKPSVITNPRLASCAPAQRNAKQFPGAALPARYGV